MADYLTLLGAEDVSRAGSAMREAASTMSNAVSNMGDALIQHQRFMDDWLQRLEQVLKPTDAETLAKEQGWALIGKSPVEWDFQRNGWPMILSIDRIKNPTIGEAWIKVWAHHLEQTR